MKSLRASTREKERLQIVGLQKDMQMTQCRDSVAIIHLTQKSAEENYQLQMRMLIVALSQCANLCSVEKGKISR